MSNAQLCFPDEYNASQWKLQEFDVSPLGRELGVPSVERLPRWLFVADGNRVRTGVPVQVTLYEESDQVLVECPGLHVFARGSTQESALDDLDQQVVYFFRRYTSVGADEVTGLAARLRDIYINNFSCDND